MTTFDIIVLTAMIVLAVATTGIMVYSFFVYNKADKSSDLVELLKYYKQWNDQIQTKQGVLDFYALMNETCREVWNTEFKLQITKEEFEQLPIETLKQLNLQALETLIDNMKNAQKKRV